MTDQDPAAGLFTVDCECGTTFAVENISCPSCKKIKGKLNLDIPEFLNRVYQLSDEKKKDRALDVVFDVFWNLHDKFDVMNDILGQLDFSRLSKTLLVGFMVQTFKYANQVPNHKVLCDKAEARIRELGGDDKEVHDLVDPYRVDAADFWKDMSALGAPEWLTGPKPQ